MSKHLKAYGKIFKDFANSFTETSKEVYEDLKKEHPIVEETVNKINTNISKVESKLTTVKEDVDLLVRKEQIKTKATHSGKRVNIEQDTSKRKYHRG